ncbi:minor tail protein [Gordonia phage Nubi]|uniref:Minor tail protein n=1 Tax=Gordonia phage Nubi TaxID=2588492 RepID=A0A514CXC0_9CAUD|nr:minor tail protein [Gordonia phage Nubi]QDH85168.1 minor tail protein [Gordonia phage Nubi]
MSTPSLDWADGDVVLDVNVGSVSTVDVPIPRGVEVLVVQGKDGTGVNLQGAVLTYADLPDDLGPLDAGHAYLVQGNGKLYVWSGTAWPSEANGADFRGEPGLPGRGITAGGISVVGNKLRFAMSDSTIDEATVPAIQQAIDSAAAASGSATAANTARLAAEAAASTAGTAASTATTERTAAQTARTGAESARDTALSAATAADNSADAAATSETNAETAETNAAGSALAAAGSASAANTRATDADTARAAAVTARTDAQTARDTASGYATAAQTAADAAEDSAAAAAASAEEAADVVASGVPNATTTTKGGIVLAGDLGGTWDEPTVPALAMKADLDENGKLLSSQIPAQATHESVVVTSTAERLALTTAQVQRGDTAVQIGNPGRGTYSLQGDDPADPASWVLQVAPTDAVSSVNGYNGIVVLGKGDVGLGNVDNTSDLNKPISTQTQTALDGKVDEVTTANVAYGTKTGGVQGTWPVTSAATATTLALRGTGGTVPGANGHRRQSRDDQTAARRRAVRKVGHRAHPRRRCDRDGHSRRRPAPGGHGLDAGGCGQRLPHRQRRPEHPHSHRGNRPLRRRDAGRKPHSVGAVRQHRQHRGAGQRRPAVRHPHPDRQHRLDRKSPGRRDHARETGDRSVGIDPADD